MTLSQPENQHVLKSFSLEGKVVAITGENNPVIRYKSVDEVRLIDCGQVAHGASALRYPELLQRLVDT